MIKLNVPFYRQSTDFTCDPACLMMALKYFFPRTKFSQELEFDIWREAYGIGIPGCMPQGLAYSSLVRGLNATLICKKEKIIEISEKIAQGENKKIALFTSKKLFEKAKINGMTIIDKTPDLTDIEKALVNNELPLVMINMKLLHEQDSPHWIIISGIDKENVRINDPYVEDGEGCLVERNKFLQMLGDLRKYSGIAPRVLLLKI